MGHFLIGGLCPSNDEMLVTLVVINDDLNLGVWTLHFKNQPREGALYHNF